MIGFMVARHSFLWIRTKPKQICTAQNRATVARKLPIAPKNYSKWEGICVEDIFQAELPTPKSLRERCLGVHCPGTVQNEALVLMHRSISLL